MAAPDDDQFEDDPELDQFAHEFEERESALHDLVSQFMDEEEIDEAYAAQMLLSLAMKMRMMAYVMEVEKPSVGGLKLDLDRMQQELAQFVREAKKGAAEYLELAKEARAEAMGDAEEEDGEGGEASEDAKVKDKDK